MTMTPSVATDRAHAEALDAADPLAPFQDRFVAQPDDVVAYLDGNSLGRPLAAIERVWTEFTQHQWAARLIRGWTEGWMELPELVGDELGSAALGAAPGQTVIADSTTVNFYKALRAAVNLRPDRRRVVLDRDNFPTDRYVAESLVRDLGLELVWVQGTEFGGVTPDDLAGVLDERTAVLSLSHIAYRSGFLADAAAITRAAHAVGAVTVWDLSHSVGLADVQLDAWNIDFAVGCTYKFVGAGPGAPAFSYVNARHLDALDQPIWGWLGRRDPFEMEQGYESAPGIRGMLSGTPPVLGILAVREGARLIAEAGIGAIRRKAEQLTSLGIDLADEWLLPQGFSLGTPREADRRGGHITLHRADARQVCADLIAAGVLPDFRTPDAIRVGLSPLPTRYAELWDAMRVLRDLTG